MLDFATWTLLQSATVFAVCAVVIGVCGVWITGVVDQLADRTGLGEAVTGAVLLGAATSLSGSVLSVTAAWNGLPELALGNALGGIAAQTAFLVVADIVYRNANLEHAAASIQNLMQSALLIALLALILLGPTLPELTILGIHPLTPVLFGVYIYGIAITDSMADNPMWRPAMTRETRQDKPEDLEDVPDLRILVIRFDYTGHCGWTMEKAASIAHMSATAVGVLFTAITARTCNIGGSSTSRRADSGGGRHHRRQRFRHAVYPASDVGRARSITRCPIRSSFGQH